MRPRPSSGVWRLWPQGQSPPSLLTVRHLDHPHVAPLWKRSLASWVDSLPWLGFVIVQIRRRDCSKPPLAVATLMSSVYAVTAPTMFGRTVGQRVCNIRVVSQETGRSPALKQSFVMWAIGMAPRLVLTFSPKTSKQSDSKLKALQAETKQLEQEHRGDREARNRAIMALYEERNFNPLRAILPGLLCMVLDLAYARVLRLSVRRDPLNQGLAAGRAKILVIDERPSSFPRLAALIARREPVPSAGRLIHLVPVRKRRAA